MKHKARKDVKYQFNIDFQENILKYILTDLNGYQAINLIEDYYFDLIEHQVIMAAIKSYFKKHKRIPSKVLIREKLRQMYNTRDLRESITDIDKGRIEKLIKKLFQGYAKDGDIILEEIIKFSRYTSLKEEIETLDVHDYAKYEDIVKRIQKATTKGSEIKEQEGTFLIKDIKKRQLDRQMRESTFPFPFWQLNKLTNGNGYSRGAVIVILDKPKGFKTGILANIARGYLRLRKKVIMFDLENGEDNLSLRFEQAIARKNKNEITGGMYDTHIQKIMRKYARLGVEIVIKRLPAYSTTDDMQKWVDRYYKDHGIVFDECVIDYMGLMGSVRGDKDDNERISNAYIDVKNFAERNKFEHVWTAHHIIRTAYKRRSSKYQADDTAKCIDIHRHVEMMLGLQQSPEEKEGNVWRLEVIDQRDGLPEGSVLFWGDIEKQRLDEFKKSEVKSYHDQQKMTSEESEQESKEAREKNRKRVADV